jgi:hypothetical protein
MPWLHGPKVSVVEGRELSLFEPLDDGQHGGIHESDVQIRVAVDELPDASKIVELKLFDSVCASQDVVEQGHEHSSVHARVDPVVHLHEHGGGNDEHLIGMLDQLPATGVIGIAPIERCVERACIEDQRHDLGSGRSFPDRRAVSA